MKKKLKIILIIIGTLCLAFATMIFIAETRPFSRMDTFRSRMAADREKVHLPERTDTVRPCCLKAVRGSILDCRGRVLAAPATVYDIFFDAVVNSSSGKWDSDVKLLSDSLAVILGGKSAGEYYSFFRESRQNNRRYVRICSGTDSLTFCRLQQLPIFRRRQAESGIIIDTVQTRQYPYGALDRRTIGFVRPDIRLAAKNIGIEGRYDGRLSGEDGYRTIQTRWIKWPLRPAEQKTESTVSEPRNGTDVRTTLDIVLQAKADSVLRAGIEDRTDVEGACLVLADVSTGAIRTMVNLVRDGNEEFRECYNVSIGRSFEPGAVLSPAAAIAASGCGISFPAIGEPGGDCMKAFADSLCSIVSGGDWDRDAWDIAGLRETSCMSPCGESSFRSLEKGYGIQATALDCLALYTAIARGGDGIRLHLVRRDTAECYRVCTREQAGIISRSLADGGLKGIAHGATGLTVAGRTGTSFEVQPTGGYVTEDGKRTVQASFAGFFPADDPEYSVICMVYSKPASGTVILSGLPSAVVAGLAESLYE